MSGHTPGPWRAGLGEEYLPTHGECEFACLSHGWLVTIEIYALRCAQSAGEQEANARLIAAAPELLAALQGMFNNSGSADWPADIYDAAKEALAKATGASA